MASHETDATPSVIFVEAPGAIVADRARQPRCLHALRRKLFVPNVMIAHSPPLGIPEDIGFYRLLGAILAVSVALYIWRRTSVLGAVLTTGYLGGAIAINLRAGMPLTHSMFASLLGLLVWGGLLLRDARLRGLFS